MRVAINSLKKYTKINLSKEELIEKVFKQIGAVENIEDWAEKYKGIVIGKIMEKKDHPEADKLGVYQVNIGTETTQVVAGDKTLEVGDLVAYLAPGVKVPYNTHPEKFDGVITKVKLKGFESNGMLASARELDFGNDHTGVMRLNDVKAQPGDSLAEKLDLNDTILDIENKALANRGDLFGLINIAREISGIQNLPFVTPDWLVQALSTDYEGDAQLPIKIENQAEVFCSRFMAVKMKDIKIKQSPMWLKIELLKAGIRPINNVVDVTNYLMYLSSQPLHAYDYDKVAKKDLETQGGIQIIARLAKNGEKLTVIDGKTVELDDSVLIIADAKSPLGVAGIMGGLDTEIDDNTKNIVIECANFDRYNIRRSSMKLGIYTDAVTRFTKALDPNLTQVVLAKTLEMLGELAGGKQASKVQDIYPSPIEAKSINISVKKANQKLGLELTTQQMTTILTNINYNVSEIKNGDDDELVIKVPTLRQDIAIPEDIYEDLGRQFGYDNIKITLPTRTILPSNGNPFVDFKNRVRNILSNNGGNEALTYNLVSKTLLDRCKVEYNDIYHIKNPLSPELSYMRLSVLPSIVEKVQENLIHGFDDFVMYELNKGHNKSEIDTQENLPAEREYLAIVSLDKQSEGSSYYSMKALFNDLITKLKLKEIEYKLLVDVEFDKLPLWIRREFSMFNPYRSAVVYSDGNVLGVLGEASNSLKQVIRLPKYTSLAEFDLGQIYSSMHNFKNYVEPSRYPSVVEDYSFQVPYETQYNDLYKVISESINNKEINTTVTPVDIYSNDNDMKIKKITVRISLQPKEKTLENKEINAIREKIAKKVSEKLQGKRV